MPFDISVSSPSILPVLVAGQQPEIGFDGGTNGTPGPNVKAYEYSPQGGFYHATLLTFRQLPIASIPGGGGSFGTGALLYTLSPGAEIIEGFSYAVALNHTQNFIQSDTPNFGIGTVIGGPAGVLATTQVNIAPNKLAPNSEGTPSYLTGIADAGAELVIESGYGNSSGGLAHSIFFNVGNAAWSVGGDVNPFLSGQVLLTWRNMLNLPIGYFTQRGVPRLIVQPTISGVTANGSPLTATTGLWDNPVGIGYTYQWFAAGVPIALNGQASTYTTLVGQIGQAITCAVSAFNQYGAAAPALSSNSITVT